MSNIDYTSIACGYCGASEGQGCKTSGGHATRPHSERTRPLIDAYMIGYHDGQEDLLKSTEWYKRVRRSWLAKEGQSEEISVKVHHIPQDGYPDMSNLTGQVAFLWDGNVVTGWPLDGDGGEYEPDLDDDGFLLWAGNSDVARTVEFHGVRYWLEFPEPLRKIERAES